MENIALRDKIIFIISNERFYSLDLAERLGQVGAKVVFSNGGLPDMNNVSEIENELEQYRYGFDAVVVAPSRYHPNRFGPNNQEACIEIAKALKLRGVPIVLICDENDPKVTLEGLSQYGVKCLGHIQNNNSNYVFAIADVIKNKKKPGGEIDSRGIT